MNKMIIVIAGITAFFLINSGFSLRSQIKGAKEQKDGIMSENLVMEEELGHKQGFRKNVPKTMSNAFSCFVNETKMFETYSGTRMNIVLTGTKENEDIEDHYVGTEFRHVKGLPISISVEKYSNESDMIGVLNDICLLEKRTDFKVSEISTDNNCLIVKGELYGV